MNTPIIQFDGVSKRYHQHQVLQTIDLEVREHEYLGLVGVNGAGKSTLIKCLLDFTLVDEGSISIGGINHLKTAAREHIGYLPEKFLPPYYLTGKEFIQYMLELYQVSYNHEAVLRMLDTLDLRHDSLHKTVGQLSKGMAQKMGLAACLLSERRCFILDEPMSGLDPKARAYLKQHLKTRKEQGQTLFFSTHLLADVQALCDRMAILHDSQLRFVGTPEECCQTFGTDDLEQAYLRCISETVAVA